MSPSSYSDYIPCGVCVLFDKETLNILGYNYSEYESLDIVMIKYRSKDTDPEIDDDLCFCINKDNKLKYIHPNMIKAVYTLDEGKDLYPELFI
jgi:hypothetical protein